MAMSQNIIVHGFILILSLGPSMAVKITGQEPVQNKVKMTSPQAATLLSAYKTHLETFHDIIMTSTQKCLRSDEELLPNIVDALKAIVQKQHTFNPTLQRTGLSAINLLSNKPVEALQVLVLGDYFSNAVNCYKNYLKESPHIFSTKLRSLNDVKINLEEMEKFYVAFKKLVESEPKKTIPMDKKTIPMDRVSQSITHSQAGALLTAHGEALTKLINHALQQKISSDIELFTDIENALHALYNGKEFFSLQNKTKNVNIIKFLKENILEKNLFLAKISTYKSYNISADILPILEKLDAELKKFLK